MSFEAYYNKLSLTQPIRDRLDEILGQMAAICPETITDIFLSEYVQDDGTHVNISMWAISPQYTLEGRLENPDDISFDIVRHKRSVIQIRVEHRHFDWNSAAGESARLTVAVSFIGGFGIQATLKATGPNCEVLRDIVHKYYKGEFAE